MTSWVLLVSLLATQTPPPAPVLQVRIEPDPVAFAEPFDVVIEVVRPRGQAVTLPASIPEKKAVRLLGEPRRTVLEPPPGDDRSLVREIIRVPFVALDLEDVETPAFVVTAADGTAIDVPGLPVRVLDGVDGGPIDAAAPAQEGEVDLLGAATHRLYQVADARPYVLFGTFAFSFLGVGLLRLVERRRTFSLPAVKVAAAPQKAKRPAHEVALERLEALLAEGLLVRGEVTLFVQRLMDEVLRDYLEERFTMPAGTRTTRELCQDLLTLSAPGLDVGRVKEVLEAADLVKFARAALAGDAAHQMAGSVRALIEATALRAPPPGFEGDATSRRA